MSLESRIGTASTDSVLNSAYDVLPMGLAYVAPNKTVNIQGSDRPYEHTSEAQTMDGIVKDYLHSDEGKRFMDYAHSRGRKFIQLVGAGSADLGEHVVAAVIHDGEKGVIVSNYDGKDFRSRVSEFASMYGVNQEVALEYVLTHEFGHIAGYNTEESNERFVGEYFMEMAGKTQGTQKQKYEQLAAVAQQRETEAKYTENN